MIDRREVDHGAVSCALPDGDQHDDERPGAGLRVELGHRAAEGAHQRRDKAVVIVDEVVHQKAYQHRGNEVGQEHQRLRDLLEPLAAHLVEQHREAELQKVTQQYERQVVKHGVAQKQRQLARLEQELEVLQAHEGAVEDALRVIELGERDVGAGQRNIRKREEENNRRKAHQDRS